MPTERVQATFLAVVEKLTFMFGEAVAAADLPATAGEYSEAWLTFSGAAQGRLAVIVPSELTPEIAGNILGLDPADVHPGEMMADALRELLNVISGHVVMALVTNRAEFKLSAPEHRQLTQAQWRALCEDEDSAAFLLDDSPVLLNLKLE
jgi:chemotaxis protein CheY-P-specific phosphatase CheC